MICKGREFFKIVNAMAFEVLLSIKFVEPYPGIGSVHSVGRTIRFDDLILFKDNMVFKR